jgi:ribosomal protein S4
MARYLGSRSKISRKLNLSVCGSDRCVLLRRNTPPGMHPNLHKRISDFKRRLIEKQKLRFFLLGLRKGVYIDT